jgi:beta-galactosidase
VLDAAGRVVPTADNLVRFSVEGPAKLIAVGNGDPTDHSSYQAYERGAFHGLALAILQSTDEVGQVRVTARAEGLQSASVSFTVVRGEGPPRLE